jgi:hypothetical protein
MYRLRQLFDSRAIEDVGNAIEEEFSLLDLSKRIRPGQRVAVAVGSRGIDRLPEIVAAVVKCLRALGLEPFILPAMGSHGQGTAEGQTILLNELGVNESAVGAPVCSSMEVNSLGHIDSGAEVFVSRDAVEADHLVLIGRIKPHTAFRADVESGLCKMLAVGCGKHAGAAQMHKFGLGASIIPAAKLIAGHVSILCGLAIVENSLDRTHLVKLALPDEFSAVDQKCLKLARELLPVIPLNDLDILIIDEMGKNISGAGIDPNIVGFWRREGGLRTPDYRTLIVLDITAHSHGNALGIGMADLTTRRVMGMIDLKATYTNALASGIWSGARLPIALENDRQAIETAISRVPDLNRIRMARIINTLHLETFWATKPLLSELQENGAISIDQKPIELAFDKSNRLLPFNAY